jgi:aminoglycoside phosphotransferase (APT) family kinase protein
VEVVGSGRNADVFALDGRRVLRRYRDGGDVAAEAATMAYVARFGYPVPRVHHASGPDLVLDRVDGPTMLTALAAGTIDGDAGARLLADLHTRLHALPPRGGDPAHTVLHLDLHPDNVMLGPAGPVVIDWRNAEEGPADLDVAQTALITAEVAVDLSHPMAGPARGFVSAFLHYAGGRPGAALATAVARRRRDPALTADETGRLDAAAALVAAALAGRR